MTLIAETMSGAVEGREKEEVLLFSGIPYAAPPVGELRFRAAESPAPWNGVKSTTRFGPAAPQIPTGGLTDAVPVNWDEDCLTLNISTPALDGKKRPVLVWIHGGGYRTGQGGIPWYNGARFSKNGDIVVVSINYRMGALAFTDLTQFGAEYATSGVNGTLDQIFALEWVRDNITAFGGDSAQVTIAGESAGGFSVATLLGSPRAAGLFQRAIPQSGAAHHTLPAEAGKRVTEMFLQAMAVSEIDELLAAPVDAILKAQQQVDEEVQAGAGRGNQLGGTVSPFYPVVGNQVLPRSPLEAIRDGAGSDVPVLTGTNHDEATLFGYGSEDEENITKAAQRFGGGEALLDAYRKERPDATPGDIMVAMATDQMFRIPAVRLAEARAAHQAGTWMYEFCWQSRNGNLRATHSLEIPFMFDNLDRGGVDFFLGEGPQPQQVADAMHAAWTAFIRDGDPGWPVYTPDSRLTMRFDESSAVVEDPDATSRQAWEGLR